MNISGNSLSSKVQKKCKKPVSLFYLIFFLLILLVFAITLSIIQLSKANENLHEISSLEFSLEDANEQISRTSILQSSILSSPRQLAQKPLFSSTLPVTISSRSQDIKKSLDTTKTLGSPQVSDLPNIQEENIDYYGKNFEISESPVKFRPTTSPPLIPYTYSPQHTLDNAGQILSNLVKGKNLGRNFSTGNSSKLNQMIDSVQNITALSASAIRFNSSASMYSTNLPFPAELISTDFDFEITPAQFLTTVINVSLVFLFLLLLFR